VGAICYYRRSLRVGVVRIPPGSFDRLGRFGPMWLAKGMTSLSVPELIKWTIESAHRTRNAITLTRTCATAVAFLVGMIVLLVSTIPPSTVLTAVGVAGLLRGRHLPAVRARETRRRGYARRPRRVASWRTRAAATVPGWRGWAAGRFRSPNRCNGSSTTCCNLTTTSQRCAAYRIGSVQDPAAPRAASTTRHDRANSCGPR
jgi:hypothetical protein